MRKILYVIIGRGFHRMLTVIGAFPNAQSCLNLAAAKLRHIAGMQWSTPKYMKMALLYAEQTSNTEAVA